MDEDPLDLIVVGAGLYGIAATRTYLELHPTCKLRVLEADEGVGGVWSRKRLYPGFWSQTGVRIAGYPDVPLTIPSGAEDYHDLIEGKYMASYLEEYVSNHVYDGRSMRDRFVFDCKVDGIRKRGDVWHVAVTEKGESKAYRSEKLLVATGNHSMPSMPTLPGSDAFNGRIIHQRDLGQSKAMEDKALINVAILGGGKSAADVAYTTAKEHGKKVSWIIRKSGAGPAFYMSIKPPPAMTRYGYKNSPEIGSTRLAGWLGQNPFIRDGWIQWFLHRTSLGESVLKGVWGGPLKENKMQAGFGEFRREGALEGFEGLESTGTVRYATVPIGMVQREDFWDIIADKVNICRSDVSHLDSTSIHLRNGKIIRADVLVCATGWVEVRPYFDREEALRLGLSQTLDEVSDHYRSEWQSLDAEAEARVLERFPQLAHTNPVPRTRTPYRLYNAIASLTDTSVAFVGSVHVQNNFRAATVQALWAAAFLDEEVDLPPVAEQKRDIAFLNAWCRRRYPATGQLGKRFDFEMASYCDRLLDQLGLRGHRTKGWWGDLVRPCLTSDYAGLIDEWKALRHRKKRGFRLPDVGKNVVAVEYIPR